MSYGFMMAPLQHKWFGFLAKTFPVTKSAKPGSPVCPDCKKVYEGLKKGE